jgi:mannosyltransferase OCH1-like enzyme
MNIIQTWKNDIIPEHYERYVNKVQLFNPDWNYMFFTDNNIVEFIQQKMPEYWQTFSNLTTKIQQIDFFRYLAIYYYGGIYLDLDVDVQQPFDDFTKDKDLCIFPIELKNVSDVLLIEQQFNSLVGNYAFYSPPKHPFLKLIIDNIVTQRISMKDIERAQSTCTDHVNDVYVYYRTGPVLVTQTYIDYKATGKEDTVLLMSVPYFDNCFGNYGYHRCHGSWRYGFSNQVKI